MLRRLSSAAMLLLLFSDAVHAERLPGRLFTTADGLAHTLVTRIVRDSRGYQWYCTREGLSRFDGIRFITYGTDDGLPSAEVHDLLETRQGVYWVATALGLVRFDPMGFGERGSPRPMFSPVAPAGSNAPLAVTALREDRAGDVWAGTLSGLYRLAIGEGTRSTLEAVDLGLPAEVLSLAEHPGGDLWVGTGLGVFRVSGGRPVARYTTREGLPGNFVRTLLSDRDSRLWVGTADGGLAVLGSPGGGGRFTVLRVFTPADGLAGTWINAVVQTTDGQVWVATNAGVARMRPGAVDGAVRPRAEMVPIHEASTGALCLAEGRGQNLWVGTPAGVTRVLLTGFVLFSAGDGIPAGSSLMETRAGDLLTMTAGATVEGAARFDGRRFVPLRLPIGTAGVSWGWDQLMLVDRDGGWWIGTRSGALRLTGITNPARLHLARHQRFSTADGLTADVVLRLFEDSRGDVWIATVGEGKPNGLSRWERSTGRLHHYRSDQAIPDLTRYSATAFTEDRSGVLWIGFSNGALVRIRAGIAESILQSGGPRLGSLRGLLVSSDGTVWGATTSRGLLRVAGPAADRPVISTITQSDGLSSNEVGAIVEDSVGRIYAGTARGIDRIEPEPLRITHYGTADGIPTGEVFSAIRDHNGTLWFGHNGGVVRFVPRDPRPVPPVAVLIDGLTVNERHEHVSALGQSDLGRYQLPPGRSAMQISYLAPGPGPMERVRYQIRLGGENSEWSAPSDQRTVSFANIGPGFYRFSVRAVTADGAVSSNEAGFDLVVLAPLWQRWWFLSGALVLSGAAGYGLYRFRLVRMMRIAEIRARIARDLHDDVGANLTRIAVLAEVGRRRGVAALPEGSLQSIATVARESMSAMGEIVWAVDPERDRVGDMTGRMREYAEEVFGAAEVSLSVAVPASLKELRLPANVRRDLYLIFKEAASNAARHSGCSRFAVVMRKERRTLSLSMSDDGRGFEMPGGNGNGLGNMRRRATMLRGRLTIQSSPNRGTTVVIEVPVGGRPRLFVQADGPPRPA